MARAYKELLALGFAEQQTGGGCTALRRDYPDGSYHLITLADDPTAPDAATRDDAMVQVGLFDDGAYEPSADDFADTLASVAATFRENARHG